MNLMALPWASFHPAEPTPERGDSLGPKAKLPASEGRRPHLLPSWAAPSGCRVVLLATSPESAGEILSRRAVRIMARPSENPEFQAGTLRCVADGTRKTSRRQSRPALEAQATTSSSA